MNNEFDQIKRAVKNIKLDDVEKEKMRVFIFENIQPVEITQNKNVINSIIGRLYEYYQNIKNYYSMSNKYKLVPAVAVSLFIILVGGTSAFAERAVPGDFLYGIKVSVNEPVAGLFAFTKEEKTEWQERLVERRLGEVQKLVVGNNLTEKNRVYLEGAIQKQIDNFNTSADELAVQKNESVNSSDINIRLQAALAAHQDVLLTLSNDKNVNTETKQETEQLLSALTTSQDRVKNGHNDLESLINTKSSATLSGGNDATATADLAVAQEKQKAAIDSLNSMKLLYQKERTSLSANIQNNIDGKLAEVETTIKDGEALISSSDFTGAINKFQAAMSSTDAARLLLLSNTIKGDIEDDMGIGNGSGQDIEDDGFEEEGSSTDSLNQNTDNQNNQGTNNFERQGRETETD